MKTIHKAMLLNAVILALWAIAVVITTSHAHKYQSPCNMTWDNGTALDTEDCAYMGGEGWE